MKPITRDELALYVMDAAFDDPADVAAFEARLADDAPAQTWVAEEAALELLLREAADAATFCPHCDDLTSSNLPQRCSACGSAVAPGGYTIERVLVANAHGRMYVAHDADGTRVALKELAFVQSPSAQTIAAFEREAKFLRALSHPAIPRYRAAFEEGSGVATRYYLAQELVEGTPLDARLDEHFFSEAEIIDVARQVLTVLVYLQSLSPMVIHRDIKPANLLRREDGTIAVVDFGAAHVQGTTAGSTSIGTFGYMPLEQLAGQVDATTDGYALGASLHHLLTRKEPWRILTPDTIGAINVSPGVQQFLAKLVAPEPEDRHANAAAALAALDARGDTTPARVAKKKRSLTWPLVAAAALAFGGSTAAVGYAVRDLRHDVAPANDVTTTHPTPFVPPPPPLAPQPPELPRYTSQTAAIVDFKGKTVTQGLLAIAKECNLNIVVAEGFGQPAGSLRLGLMPCAALFEVVLEQYGLDYRFDPAHNLARVGPRRALLESDRAATDAAFLSRQEGRGLGSLPPGMNVDFEFVNVPLRDVLRTLGEVSKLEVVLPEGLEALASMRMVAVPADVAFREIIAVHGLGVRYRDDGRVARVAPIRALIDELRDAIDARPRK